MEKTGLSVDDLKMPLSERLNQESKKYKDMLDELHKDYLSTMTQKISGNELKMLINYVGWLERKHIELLLWFYSVNNNRQNLIVEQLMKKQNEQSTEAIPYDKSVHAEIVKKIKRKIDETTDNKLDKENKA
jgi:hypothetical protein